MAWRILPTSPIKAQARNAEMPLHKISGIRFNGAAIAAFEVLSPVHSPVTKK